MQITLEDFEKHVGSHLLHKLGLHAVPAFHQRTQRFYCQALTMRGACSGACSTCALNVKGRIERTDWTTVNSTYAVYVYHMKNLAARVIEEHAAQAKAPVAREAEVNALEQLLEMFGEQG